MCTQDNNCFQQSQPRHQFECCLGGLILSKKKKLEILNNCLNCLQEKQSEIKEAIAELT